ncbi:MAG: hypothetical protein KC684_09370, partial [Candidatus Omnitrophica bacterium]|nr:hypothetical protein [Candidatus Omnitrophota bacterium]
VILTIVLTLFCAPAFAFLYEVVIPTDEEIAAMADDKILDYYISVLIERKAAETFHGKAGFTPKEYNKFKELLGLIVVLRQEMLKREIDVPPVEEWLR